VPELYGYAGAYPHINFPFVVVVVVAAENFPTYIKIILYAAFPVQGSN